MISFLIILGSIFLAVVFIAHVVRAVTGMRRQANKALKLADRQFFEATNALLQTPDELPDTVLRLIRDLSELAFAPGADASVLRSMKRLPAPSGTLPKSIQTMRPELVALLVKALEAWVAIMMNRSILVGVQIREVALRNRLAAGRISPNPAKDTVPVVSQLLAMRRDDMHCAA